MLTLFHKTCLVAPGMAWACVSMKVLHAPLRLRSTDRYEDKHLVKKEPAGGPAALRLVLDTFGSVLLLVDSASRAP